jgi:hypothetical protein
MKISKILILLSLILFSINSLKASCPSGYQEGNTQVTLYGCTMYVTYCYLCSATGIGFDIANILYTTSHSCIRTVATYQTEFDRAAEIEILKQLMTISGCLKLCSDPGWALHKAEIKRLSCRNIICDAENEIFRMEECPGSPECHLFYKVCVTIVNGQPVLTYEEDGTYENPGPECMYFNPEEIPIEPLQDWESGCVVWGYCGF